MDHFPYIVSVLEWGFIQGLQELVVAFAVVVTSRWSGLIQA